MNKFLLITIFIFSTPFGAFAETPSFHFAQLSYSTVDFNGLDNKLNGFEFKMNYQVTGNFYLNYENLDLDSSNANLNTRNIGFGYHSKMIKTFTYFGQIDWLNMTNNNQSLNQYINDDGYRLSAGMINQRFKDIQFKAIYEYQEIADENGQYFYFEGLYQVTNKFSIFVSRRKQIEGSFDQYIAGIRYNF